jgi:hypothetical protein
MGIQAGLTSLSDGASRLERSRELPVIDKVDSQLYEVYFGDASSIRQARVYLASTPDSTVERINLFDTGIPLSSIFLAFGKPERIVIYNTTRLNVVAFVAFYSQYQLFYALTDLQVCDVNQAMLWSGRRDVSIGIGVWRDEAEQPDYYLSSIELDADRWANQLRLLKRISCL